MATTRVSTMERELNEAGAEGFRLKVVGDDIDSGEGLVDETMCPRREFVRFRTRISRSTTSLS